MSIEEIYKLFKKYPVISTDSRNVPQDALFFALKGENFNGNRYGSYALDNGAAYAVIDEAEYKINENYQILKIDNENPVFRKNT